MSAAFGVTGAIWTVVQWSIALIILGIIIAVIVTIMRYNIKFRVREVIGGKTRIIDDRAKPITDAEGVLKWRLWKWKTNVPIPPPEAIHLTNKGKYSVEAYYLPEGEFKYVIDGGCDSSKLTNFEPLDTADREFYVAEMREAEQYRQKKWMDYILPAAGLFVIFGVLVVMLVFWEDIAKPGITISETAAQTAVTQDHTMGIIRDILQNRQQIENINIPILNDTGGGR